MKTGVKITLLAGALTILTFASSPLWYNVKPKPITNGFITKMWMVPAHHDVRLRSPGVWEEAWLDTMYFMELHNPDLKKFRTVEVHPSMYYNKENIIGQWKELGDSAKYAKDRTKALEEEKEWGANKRGKKK